MEKIKIELINVFNILQKAETNEENMKKYMLLKKIYQKINLNEKLLMKLNKELDDNQDTLENLTIFNKTSFKELYESMNVEQQMEIKNKLLNMKTMIIGEIMGDKEEHVCGESCNHGTDLFDPEQLMQSKKMQKILNNKRLKYNLEQQLRKTTGMKNSSLEEILKSNIPKEQKKMMESILNNKTVKKMTEKLLNEDNLIKIKDIFLSIIEREDVKVELDKVKCIIDEDNFVESITEIYNEFQKTQDLKDIERLIKENTKLQDVIKKIDNSFKTDVLNIEKLKTLLMNVMKDFGKEIMNLEIIDETDISNMKGLLGNFNMLSGFLGSDKKPKEDESTKKRKEKKRRDKARKDYRRKLRSQYKKKKTKGGSV